MTVVLCGISSSFEELFPISRQITHVLLTRAPLYSSRRTFAFDLHVLGTPPALVLSQNQTLQLTYFTNFPCGISATKSNRKFVPVFCSLKQITKETHFGQNCTSYLVFRERALRRCDRLAHAHLAKTKRSSQKPTFRQHKKC